MGGWVDGWKVRCNIREMDQLMGRCIDILINIVLSGWMDSLVDGWIDW